MKPISLCFDASLFGNKARNLAILARENFRIPKGFVVPSNYVFDRLGKSPQSIEKERLLRIVPENPLLGEELIVRSSSVIEDGNVNSAAGLYYSARCNELTYPSELVNVWKSPYTAPVLLFKNRFNLQAKEDIAVIIMTYLESNLGGVLFTKHPSFSDMVLEVSKFGSSGVTSGESMPSLYELPRDIHLDKRFEQLYYDSRRIEKTFGSPQDIEFLFSNTEIVYLQTRPVTFKRHKI